MSPCGLAVPRGAEPKTRGRPVRCRARRSASRAVARDAGTFRPVVRFDERSRLSHGPECKRFELSGPWSTTWSETLLPNATRVTNSSVTLRHCRRSQACPRQDSNLRLFRRPVICVGLGFLSMLQTPIRRLQPPRPLLSTTVRSTNRTTNPRSSQRSARDARGAEGAAGDRRRRRRRVPGPGAPSSLGTHLGRDVPNAHRFVDVAFPQPVAVAEPAVGLTPTAPHPACDAGGCQGTECGPGAAAHLGRDVSGGGEFADVPPSQPSLIAELPVPTPPGPWPLRNAGR